MTTPLTPGQPVSLQPGIARLVAPNPGPMTGPGTNTYLLGKEAVAVIDPGPAIEAHVAAIIAAAAGPIRWILTTHTHVDHSPAARMLAERTGAATHGQAAPPGKSQDRDYLPEVTLNDGDTVEIDGFTVQAVHTPGHASNHLCYRLAENRWLFTGDHVMNGSTVVINPPDGDMQAYLDSLHRLRDLDLEVMAPGHGDTFDQPDEVVDWIVAHRLRREAKVLDKLRAHGPGSIDELVTHVYDDVDVRMHPVAERSLLAHLLKLQHDGLARSHDDRWLSI